MYCDHLWSQMPCVSRHEPGHAISERERRLERAAAAEELDGRELARARPELVQGERHRLEAVLQQLPLRGLDARVSDARVQEDDAPRIVRTHAQQAGS
jgi:hypothetical protein